MRKKEMQQLISQTHRDIENSSNDSISKSFLTTDFEFYLTDKNIEQLKQHFNVKVTGIMGYVEFSKK